MAKVPNKYYSDGDYFVGYNDDSEISWFTENGEVNQHEFDAFKTLMNTSLEQTNSRIGAGELTTFNDFAFCNCFGWVTDNSSSLIVCIESYLSLPKGKTVTVEVDNIQLRPPAGGYIDMDTGYAPPAGTRITSTIRQFTRSIFTTIKAPTGTKWTLNGTTLPNNIPLTGIMRCKITVS